MIIQELDRTIYCLRKAKLWLKSGEEIEILVDMDDYLYPRENLIKFYYYDNESFSILSIDEIRCLTVSSVDYQFEVKK